MPRRLLVAILSISAAVALAIPARATQVWSGRTLLFSKSANADWTQPVNQDRITSLVWITRASSMGIFNIEQESAFVVNVSPVGTEWATGDAVNHASLTFKTWQQWSNNNPPLTVGVNACVHLIAEDIYLDIVFVSFGSAGGAFSYRRAQDPATAAAPSSWGRLKRLFR